MTTTTRTRGPMQGPLDRCTPPAVALALLSALVMLGGGAGVSPMLALAACGGALAILLVLELDYRRARWAPHPVMQALDRATGRATPLRRVGGVARTLYLVDSVPAPVTAATQAPPLQRLAQAQGDQHFLMECRRNVSTRWLVLLEEMESAWARRRTGDLRWPLYQLRMQSALWGAEALSRQAREFERLLERESILGFEYRCGRTLASLRAMLEGRPTAG